MRFKYNSIMDPVMLKVILLCSLSNSYSYAVVANRQQRHAEAELSLENLTAGNRNRLRLISDKCVISKQCLPQSVFDKKTDYRTK